MTRENNKIREIRYNLCTSRFVSCHPQKENQTPKDVKKIEHRTVFQKLIEVGTDFVFIVGLENIFALDEIRRKLKEKLKQCRVLSFTLRPSKIYMTYLEAK
ncbi:hypothetical protein PHYBLDRAFT_61715 [Phycomyces blakesleeanus NRRL 1555(-)]|uniref:Uncharacterized protein n=1 Tax=Phycomyces blakesleeanus (strain ATCC 8743b / DSM 1359 / FGSC 10004 / NBRC 33097 / NRRL 1555) TaxID=763407 RepID=A0A163BCN4_PHYB8|nr:hypothetical protein PHYBLDRAFT_61715 [Phycomyces blakesleeanus NRRL 1555(-)]OAD80661.1 hypothetical protein PHYBLDRAFT_61715 [Phycomyces blakesleeanus NRRL 1555(-)]|eukprot:XP_018298701.1 hypothetical protein PHYBLDRAFT_61715 [Phycomyces blakesleeanus NRRL 1555(-)]